MHANSVIGPEVELSLEYYETIISRRFKLKNGGSAASDGQIPIQKLHPVSDGFCIFDEHLDIHGQHIWVDVR